MDQLYSDTIWKNVNMVKWLYSKISDTNSKMVMAWLPGWSVNSSDLKFMYYSFYGAISEGARGIMWYNNQYYMQDDMTNVLYNNYSYINQRDIYSCFTSTNRTWGTKVISHSDEQCILSGTPLTSGDIWKSNITYNPGTTTHYPTTIDKRFSALVLKYTYGVNSNNYRVFVVNHKHDATNDGFQIRILDSNNAWERGMDNNGNVYLLGNETYNNTNLKYFSDTMTTNDYYRIYDFSQDTQN